MHSIKTHKLGRCFSVARARARCTMSWNKKKKKLTMQVFEPRTLEKMNKDGEKRLFLVPNTLTQEILGYKQKNVYQLKPYYRRTFDRCS